MRELTLEEIVVEKNPKVEIFLDIPVRIRNKIEAVVLSPYLPHRFFADETIFGFYPLVRHLKEKYWEQLPEKYKKAIEIIEELEEKDFHEPFLKVLEKLKKNKKLTEEDKKAIWAVLRDPFEYATEIGALFKLSVKRGTDVLKGTGISVGSSPPASLYATVNGKFSTYSMWGIAFYTNWEWYGKEVSSALFLSFMNILRKKQFSPDKLFEEKFSFFWEKLSPMFKRKKYFWLNYVRSVKEGLGKPNPLILFGLSRFAEEQVRKEATELFESVKEAKERRRNGRRGVRRG